MENQLLKRVDNEKKIEKGRMGYVSLSTMGEDIFSNEPRQVHSSANYTSTAFSVLLDFCHFKANEMSGRQGMEEIEKGKRGFIRWALTRSMLNLVSSLVLFVQAIKRERRGSTAER